MKLSVFPLSNRLNTGSSLVTLHHHSVMLHFMFYKEPILSAMLPDDQLLEALPKLNADFPLTFVFPFNFGVSGVSTCSEQLQRKWEVRTLELRTSQL